MMKLPLVVTAASVAALLSAQTYASPTGQPMNYSSTIVITGLAAGDGSASGSGVFDDSGTLTLAADTITNIPSLSATATVSTSTVYHGSISGSTWTSNGTTTVTTIGCTGSPLVCGNVTPGTAPGTTTVFSADINTGGNWNSVTPFGPVTLTAANTMTPVASGGGSTPGDPNAIPTMPIYALGLTIFALFGAGARYLRSGLKRR